MRAKRPPGRRLKAVDARDHKWRNEMTESATEMRATLEDIDQQLSSIVERTEEGTDTNDLARAVHNLVRIVDNIIISLDE
jgi:hypothetical protein